MTRAGSYFAKYLAIKNFTRFQHYHKRGAPWIKVYSALLSDVAFLELPEAAQAQLVKLWLLRSQIGQPLPNNPKLLAGKIWCAGRLHLAAMIEAGFLVPCNDLASADASEGASEAASEVASGGSDPADRDDASGSLRADARSRERREVEVQRTTTTPPPPCARDGGADSSTKGTRPTELVVVDELHAQVAARLTSDASRDALAKLLAAVREPFTWLSEIAASLDAMNGHVRVTPEQASRAIREYVGNGAHANPNLRTFRRYFGQAADEEGGAEPRAPTSRNGSRSISPRPRPTPQLYEYPEPTEEIRWTR